MTAETPPTWAIEEALERAEATDLNGWSVARVISDRDMAWAKAILALATMIAKYEQPPVDPVALVLADFYEACGWPGPAMATRGGERKDKVTALRKALEKNGMLKGPTQ